VTASCSATLPACPPAARGWRAENDKQQWRPRPSAENQGQVLPRKLLRLKRRRHESAWPPRAHACSQKPGWRRAARQCRSGGALSRRGASEHRGFDVADDGCACLVRAVSHPQHLAEERPPRQVPRRQEDFGCENVLPAAATEPVAPHRGALPGNLLQQTTDHRRVLQRVVRHGHAKIGAARQDEDRW